MQQASTDLVPYRRLVQSNEIIEVSFKQGDTWVLLGQHTVSDISKVFGITANWLCASLTLSKGHVWSNGAWRIELLYPND